MYSNIVNDFNIIEKILPDNVYGKDLYHYTTVKGLKGILEDGKIQCSHIFYLNDLHENLDGWKFFFKALDSFNSTDEKIHLFKNALNKVLSHWKELNYDNIKDDLFEKLQPSTYRSFVFSLSKKDDDLNQWRSYSNNSLGFSIQFNFNELLIKNQTVHRDPKSTDDFSLHNCRILLRECIYKDEEKIDAFTKLIEYHYEIFKSESSKGLWTNALFFDILTLCLFSKNRSFASEEECRIVISTVYDFEHEKCLIHFKPGNSFLIPYIEIDTIYNCFKGITIGPTPSTHLSIESLKLFTRKIKHFKKISSSIPLRLTKIPYRSW